MWWIKDRCSFIIRLMFLKVCNSIILLTSTFSWLFHILMRESSYISHFFRLCRKPIYTKWKRLKKDKYIQVWLLSLNLLKFIISEDFYRAQFLYFLCIEDIAKHVERTLYTNKSWHFKYSISSMIKLFVLKCFRNLSYDKTIS